MPQFSGMAVETCNVLFISAVNAGGLSRMRDVPPFFSAAQSVELETCSWNLKAAAGRMPRTRCMVVEAVAEPFRHQCRSFLSPTPCSPLMEPRCEAQLRHLSI